MIKNIFIIIILFLVSILIIKYDRVDMNTKKYNLDTHGVCVLKNILNSKEIYSFKNNIVREEYKKIKDRLRQHKKLIHTLRNKTTPEYNLQDYIWIIKKSSVHTCHRDNNGDFFNKNQQYPSYTLLIYLEDMEKCLGVIPKSHTSQYNSSFNMGDKVINLGCNKGDVILFNANLIHVGTLQHKNNHMRIQMKLTHKNDINTINYYENFNKVLNRDNNIPFSIKKIQMNTSCMFPILSDITQNINIESARGSDNGAKIGEFQKYFSYLFYGNKDFYDLPNAF